MSRLIRFLVVLGAFFGASLLPLSSPSAQAGPVPGAAGAGRVQHCLYHTLQHLTNARISLASGNLVAMNAAIGRGVLELQRASAPLAGTSDPISDTIAAVLADLTATDLSTDPELAAILLERAGDDLAVLLAPGKGVGLQSGREGRLALNPPSIDFGLICPNEEHVIEVQVTNKSNTARSLSLRTTPSDPVSLAEDSPSQVGAGETVTIKVKFVSSEVGRYRKAVMVEGNAPGEPNSGVFLTIEATVRLVHVDPDPLDFDEVVVGETATKNVTVRNCTDQPLTVTPSLSAFAFGYSIPASQLPTITIPAAGTVEMPLEFKPNSANEYRAVVRFSATMPGRRRPVVLGSGHLIGRGKEPVRVGTRTLNFGTVAAGQFHTRTVDIENNTDQPQEVEIDRSKLDSEFWGVSPSGKVILSPRSVRQVSLRFGAIGRCQHRGTLIVKSPKIPRGKGNVAVRVLSR